MKWQTVNLRISRVLSIFVLQFAILVPSLPARDVQWVTVEGIALMEDSSEEEARNRALEDAMHKAVGQVVGSNISVETILVNLRLSGSIVGVIPYGRVVDKEIIEEGVEPILKKGQAVSSLRYRVRMRASVAEETTGTDPYFRVDASLNRSSFNDGDEMLITIKPTKDCYVSVFIILENEKVIRLIPSRLKENNFLKANQTFSFPDEDDKTSGIKLRVHMPEEKDAVTEIIYILALEQPLKSNAAGFQEGIYGIYNGETAFMKDLIKKIVAIPPGKRAEKLMQYQIRK